MDIELTEHIAKSDREAVYRGLEEFNRSRMTDQTPRELGLFCRDGERVTAGLTGKTHGLWLQVEYLWVTEALRGQGIGSALLRRAEAEGKRRGCRFCFADTFSFQAPDFYTDRGYREVFTLEHYPETGKRHYYVKELVPEMRFRPAIAEETGRLKEFYRTVCVETDNIRRYCSWSYGQHPAEELIEEYVDEDSVFVLETDGEIVAAAAMTMRQDAAYHGCPWQVEADDDEVAVIHMLGVLPESQGRGVGRYLMGELADLARRIGKKAVRLDVLAANAPADHLYRSMGFAERGKCRWQTCNAGEDDFLLFELAL